MSKHAKIPDWLGNFFSASTIWIFYGYTNLLLRLYTWSLLILLVGFFFILYALAFLIVAAKAGKGG